MELRSCSQTTDNDMDFSLSVRGRDGKAKLYLLEV